MEEVVDWGGRPFIAGFENESYALNQYLVTKVPGNENTTINDIDTLKTIAIDRNDKNIYFLADNNIYLFNSKNKKTDAVKLSAGKWPTAHSFDFFDDNLYFLDKINGALIKFTKQANGFSEGNEYGKPEGEELKRAVDFAINGKLVVLFDLVILSNIQAMDVVPCNTVTFPPTVLLKIRKEYLPIWTPLIFLLYTKTNGSMAYGALANSHVAEVMLVAGSCQKKVKTGRRLI